MNDIIKALYLREDSRHYIHDKIYLKNEVASISMDINNFIILAKCNHRIFFVDFNKDNFLVYNDRQKSFHLFDMVS